MSMKYSSKAPVMSGAISPAPDAPKPTPKPTPPGPAPAPAPVAAPAPVQAPVSTPQSKEDVPSEHVLRLMHSRRLLLEEDRLHREAEEQDSVSAVDSFGLAELADEIRGYETLVNPPVPSRICCYPRWYSSQEIRYECQYPAPGSDPVIPQRPSWDESPYRKVEEECDPFKDFAEIAPASGSLPTTSLRRSPHVNLQIQNRRLARMNGQLFLQNPWGRLHALKDPKTGRPCIWFPETLPELRKAGINAINQILCNMWKDFDLNVHRLIKIEWIAHQWVHFTD